MTEDQLQKAVAWWMMANHPEVMWVHIPNEGRRSWEEGKQQRKKGLRAGVPDCVFFLKQTTFIELKTETGRLSADQQAFREWADASGHDYRVCRSLQEVVDVLAEWQERGWF